MSVCRPFFTGHLDHDALFPFPSMAPEEAETLEILRDSLVRFGHERVDSRRIDAEARLPREVLDGLAELGVFGIIVPAEYDGAGASMTFYAKAFETLARIDGSIVVTVGAHQSIGLKGILLFGTDEQKRRFLPPLARGEQLAAFALTEPSAGSDAASIRTRATWSEEHGRVDPRRHEDLDHQRRHRRRVHRVRADRRRARGRDGGPDHGLHRARALEGVTTGPEEHKLGIRGSSTTEVHFEDVAVPREHVLGEVGGGFKVAMEVLNSGRLGLAAGCVGGMKQLLAEATSYAHERRQFGRPIAEFELIQKKLAGMALEIYGAESIVYLTTGLVDAAPPTTRSRRRSAR